MDEQLKANVAAAKMLGKDISYVEFTKEAARDAHDMTEGRLVRYVDGAPQADAIMCSEHAFFDLANSDDRMDAVETLGNKHEVAILPYWFRDLSGTQYRAWKVLNLSTGKYIKPDVGYQGDGLAFETHREAVGAACIAVLENQDG